MVEAIKMNSAAADPHPVMNIKPGAGGNRGILSNIKAAELPFEALDEFSSSPLEFEQTALLLWNDTRIIYDHARIENRFSENYLKYCAQLERNIKRVGSLCLTKAVLEQNGQNFPRLEEMNIRELSGMTAYHLRKCHAALEGLYWDNNLLGMTYLNWEFRWFDLSKRLNATEIKIQKIREGKISYIPMLEQEQALRNEPVNAKQKAVTDPASLRINANALPLDKSMGRLMLRNEKAERAEQLRRQRLVEKLEKETMKDFKPFPMEKFMQDRLAIRRDPSASFNAGSLLDPNDFIRNSHKTLSSVPEEIRTRMKQQPENIPEKNCPENITEMEQNELTEDEARDILIEKAAKENDHKTVMAILEEDSETFYRRWLKYTEETEKQNRLKAAARAGPSPETRKKLRQKRRKK